jgi:hypothetical protein
MSFLNPWMLLAAAGVAVPVLIHLLNRHRPKTIQWGAMELLRRVVRVRARQLRLQDILLMLLRCLAILLLVLALSRPTMRSGSPVDAADVGVLVAVDNSASMGHKPGVASRLDEAKQRAKEVFATLEPGRPVTLVSMAAQPRILLRNMGYEKGRFSRALESIQPVPEALNPQRCAEELAALLEELQAPQREMYLITDAQQVQWQQPSQGLAGTLGRIAGQARLTFVPVAPKSEDNAAVVDLQLAGGALQLGSIARFDARISNFSPGQVDVGEIDLIVDGQRIDHTYVGPLEGGESITVALRASWRKAGPTRLSVRLNSDALEVDDNRYQVVNVHESSRVLIVDGGSTDPSKPSPSHYIATALSPRSQAVSRLPIETETVSWLSLPNVSLERYDVIILANVPRLSDAKISALFDFVSAGGGLFVFLGSNVKVDAWNEGMWRGDQFLLPARLAGPKEVGGAGNESLPLDPVIPNHPLLGPLSSVPAETLADCRFDRVMQVRPVEQARTLLHLAASSEPILLEHEIGTGRVLMFTSTADRSWNTLPLNPVLPLLVQQSITYLARKPFETALAVGESMALPLNVQEKPAEVVVTDPMGRSRTLQTETRDGRFVVDLGPAQWTGFYEVAIEPDGKVIPLAVNLNPQESNIRVVQPAQLDADWAQTDMAIADAGTSLIQTVESQRLGRELWMYFLLAAIAVAVLESILAKIFTRSKLQDASGPRRSHAADGSNQQIGKAA